MKVKKTFRALISLVLILALILPYTTAVFAEDITPDEEYQAFLQTLEAERQNTNIAEEYPSGLFSVGVPASEIMENVGEPLKLYVLRHGGTQGEATIHLEFQDYSARYGEDYIVKMKNSLFEPAVEEKDGSVPILYMASEEGETYEEAFTSYDSLVALYGQESVDKMTEKLEKIESGEAFEKEEDASIENEISDQSPLMQFNNAVSMYTQEGVDTTALFATDQLDPQTAQAANDMMNELLLFAETDITFLDGEQIKELYVYPQNDNESNGERVFSMVISTEDAHITMDASNTSTVAIKDDEETELSYLYLAADQMPREVQIAEKSFPVTLKRDNALHNVSTADLYAVTDTQRVLLAGKVLLMPGVTEQVVDVPIDDYSISGASSVTLYLDNGMGCEPSSENVQISLMNGETSAALYSSTSDDAAKEYTAENSPIGFAGKGTYKGFDIYPTGDNWEAVSEVVGKNSELNNGYVDNGYWLVEVPNKNYKWNDTRIAMRSKKKMNYAVAECLEIDWERCDHEVAVCNRQVFSTDADFEMDSSLETYDNNGGTWRFNGDFGRAVQTINARTGKVDPSEDLQNSGSLTRMGDNPDKPEEAAVPTYMYFMAWKSSGGINGSRIRLYNIHVAYREYSIRMNIPENVEGKSPGAMNIISRDGKTITTQMNRYATEDIALSPAYDNTAFEFCGLQIKEGSTWKDIDAKYYSVQNKMFYFSADFIQQYYKCATDDYTIFDIRPKFKSKPVQFTLNTDENGGITFQGVNYGANTGKHTVSVAAGTVVTFSPYDEKNGYSFSNFEGSKVSVYNSADSRGIDFQQGKREQSLLVEYYNYTISPVYTADGTFLRVDTPDGIPKDCALETPDFYSVENGTLAAGMPLQLRVETSEEYIGRWKITNAEHPWYNQIFYGNHLDYRAINGANIIELTFEKQDGLENNGKIPYASVSGRVLSPQGSILNPPVSDGHGGYTGTREPLENAEIQMGRFSATTGEDGTFTIYSREEDSQTEYLRFMGNRQTTVRVLANNRVGIYIVDTRIGGNEDGGGSAGAPVQLSLGQDLVTDFYGAGPTPQTFTVLTGYDGTSLPVIESQGNMIPMADASVGFKVTLSPQEEEMPVYAVDFHFVGKDNAIKETHRVLTSGTSTEYKLLSYPAKNEDGTMGEMYFNGLMNFEEGDHVMIDIMGQKKVEGETVEFSYGCYEAGVTFYPVPGQVLITYVSEAGPASSEAGAKQIPNLDVIGAVLPKISAGPINMNVISNIDSIVINAGFDVTLLSKTLYAQKLKETPTPEQEEVVNDIEEVQRRQENGEIDEETARQEVEQIVNGAVEEGTIDPNPEPPANEDEVDTDTEPTAQELERASELPLLKNLNPLRQMKDADGLIKKLKAANGDRNALKNAVSQAGGGIRANIVLTAGVSIVLIANTAYKDYVFESCTVFATLSGGINISRTFLIPSFPIPVFLGVSFSASVGLYLGLGHYEEVTRTEMSSGDFQERANEIFYFKGNVPLIFGVEIYGGVGLQKVLSASIGGGFLQQFNFGFGPGANGNGISSFYFFASVSLVIFHTNWRFAQHSWKYNLYTNDRPTELASAEEGLEGVLETPLTDFTVKTESYANRFVGGEAQTALMGTYENMVTGTILEDTDHIQAQFVALGDGKILAVYTATDETRDAYNRLAAYYTIYHNGRWTQPQLLDSTPTLDMGVKVDELGDTVLISWSKAQKVFDASDIGENGDTIDANAILKLMSATEVYTIVANKQDIKNTDTLPAAQKITRDYNENGTETLGYAHMVNGAVKLSDGRILVVYTSTDYGSYDGESVDTVSELLAQPGVTFYRIWENGAWKEDYYPVDTAYSQVPGAYGQRLLDVNLMDATGQMYHPLTGYMDIETVVNKGEELALVTYVMDMDRELTTTQDRMVCISVIKAQDGTLKTSLPVQISHSGQVSHPAFHKVKTADHGDLTLLTWTQGEELMYLDMTDAFNGTVLSEEDKEIIRQGFESGEESYSGFASLEEAYAKSSSLITETTYDLNGQQIPYYQLSDLNAGTVAFPDLRDENGEKINNPANGYTAFSGNDGNLYVVWAQSSGAEQTIRISAMNVKNVEEGSYSLVWSDGMELSVKTPEEAENGTKEYIQEPVGCVDENGMIYLGYNRYDMELQTEVDQDGKELAVGSKRVNNRFMMTRFYPMAQLAWIEEAAVSESYPKAGEPFETVATIKNNGILAIDDLTVKARLIAENQDGTTQVLEEKEISAESNLIANGQKEIRAEFTMTQEMIDAAKGNNLNYKVRLTPVANNVEEQGITTQADVYVGAKLIVENKHIRMFNGRDFTLENGQLQMGDLNGTHRYVIRATVKNVGNVETTDPQFHFDMQNEDALDGETPYEPGMDTATIQDRLANTPLNAHVVHHENYTPFYEAGYFVKAEKDVIAPNEDGEIVLVTKALTEDLYSENGYGAFILSVKDANCDEDDLVTMELFNDVLTEENLTLHIKTESLTMDMGDQKKLNAMMLPLTESESHTIVWTSSDESVATVDPSGNVTARDAGSATIVATIEGTEVSKSVAVTVNSLPIDNGTSQYAPLPSGSAGGTDGVTTPSDEEEPEAPTTPDAWNNPFTDVTEEDWFYENVQYANQNGLMKGTSDTIFDPNGEITRGMLVTMLYRNEGEPAMNEAVPFADVDKDAYYAEAVTWAEQNGIVTGYDETTFGPEDPILREQIAAIMHRYAKYQEKAPVGNWAIRLPYTDLAEISDYAVEGVMYCTLKGMMQGKENNRFCPLDNATRAECAAILQRYIESE